ncbi:Uncharacterized conserved protein [Sphingopyxis sp. YR583]|uniref:DNA -binding domain-containing protein n=1 Tax=Sphingopyxis sp. YR583 TaxID=1881047 RepID=UPI0008A7F6E8|nr:Uncharacterized conserved protein [Sphingopyxis sp. YR583]
MVDGGPVRHCLIGESGSGLCFDLVQRDGAGIAPFCFGTDFGSHFPLRLAEFRRLRAWLLEDEFPAPSPLFQIDGARAVRVLRTIDALGEGASLRAIGTGIVCAEGWPGDGEWIKSRARRLVDAAHAMWAGGPAAMLASG